MNSSTLRPSPIVHGRSFNLFKRLAFLGLTFWPAVLLIGMLEYMTSVGVTNAAGALSIEVLAGYNLVVDSNVESPSTYAPSVATVGGRFCNTGDQPLTDVSFYIGNYVTTPANSTPGIYPTRDSSTAGFIAQHPFLANTGLYSFTHVGGSMGTADARRYVGTLAAGECRVQYWHFTYPRRGNPNNTGVAVWGDTNNPLDDLWLSFDLWGNSAEGITNNTTWTMTMRNEISAMANKIYPNGSSWFNTNTTTVRAGDIITSNGILYELGVINKGFDNDNDGEFDFNAWLQPIGDPSYDPSCFRLIRTSGLFTVSISAAPDLVIPFTDQLYFTDIPEANNGAVGNVFYTFLALNGPCFTGLSPYQEVASGADNEKFSGDYGTPGVPPIQSTAPQVSVDKSGNTTVALGSNINYQVASANTGTADAGMPLVNGGGGGGNSAPWVPVVYSDTIPAGLVYVSGSATHTFTTTGVIILYSIDNGVNWTSTEPPANQVTTIQWWLTDTLKSGESGTVKFSATVPVTYPTSYVENCASGSFDGGAAFAGDCTLTLVQGTNRIGDRVWQDDDSDGSQDVGETGISNVTVSLYLDRDGDGTIDTNDLVVMTATTSITGFYQFTGLPNGNFLVQVNSADPDLPLGYGATTPTLVSVKNLGTTTPSPYTQADFGFGPSLRVDKTMLSTNPISESSLITYLLSLINTLPGDGTGSTACQYIVWASIAHPDNTLVPNGGTSANAQWSNTGNALNTPNSLYAATNLNDNSDLLGLSGFNLGAQAGNITKVEALLYLNELVNLKGTDDLTFQLYITDTARGAADTFTGAGYFTQAVGSNYQLKIDVTSKHPGGSTGWTWGNFSGNATEMQIQGSKGSGGGSSGDLGLDAAAFLITTNQTCGGPDTTIFTLPVTDTYDTSRLQFISADPSPSLVSSGVISWANQGPLYAGQIKTIEVVFKALQPPTEANTVTTNTVAARNATFASGRAVNNATDLVTTTIIPTGSIGNFVWYDSDSDGVQDGGEVGIPNVTVKLCSSATCTTGGGNVIYATTTTDADGFYLFEGVANGASYFVQVDTTTLPAGTWTNTHDRDGSNNSVTTAMTINNTDGVGTNNDISDADFGYHNTGIIVFGNVWEDNNGNGVQTTGEDGFSGVSVAIWSCGADTICFNGDDAAVVTTTTSANGDYLFTGLTAGTRYVRVITTTLPSGGTWIQTADPDEAGKCVICNSRTVTQTLVAGGYYGGFDFGYYHSGTLSIGDTVYTDWDGDGTQDTGEEGIANITVYLYEDEDKDGVIDADDALITSTVTNASGLYTFSNLAGSGTGLGYIVVVDTTDPDLPAGYLETADPDEAGVCATCDSQAKVTLVASNVITVDFGYQPFGGGTIGDYIWRDTDHDGIQDSGEVGLANITVRLYEDSNGDGLYNAATDALIAITTTNSSGNYLFGDLPYGTGHHYLVDVDTTDTDLPLDGYGQRYVLSTNNDPHAVHLTTNSYADADFGFTAGGTIGDLVWRDDNRDGEPDGEPGLSGVRVWLYIDNDNNGVQSLGDTLVATTTTSATGIYSFTSLAPYTYVVKLDSTTLPTTTFTYDLNGALDGQAQVGLRAGMIFLSVDFGVPSDRGAIGDRIWIDENGDDVYQTYENGLSGIVVTLTSASGVTTTTTDADGYYLFPYLLTGTYTVTYNSAGIPSGLAQTFEGDGTLNRQIVVNLGNAQNYLTADFAYAPNLNVTKTSLGAHNPLQAGDMLTYTIVISNPSSIGVIGSVLSDSLPANTNFVNGSGTISPASAGTVGSLPNLVNPLTVTANSAVTVTFRVTVTNPIPGGITAITNTVLLTTTAGITDTDTVTNPVAIASPDLSITKTDGVVSTTPGATLVYTLTITNSGSGGATGVLITDTIPANTTFVAASNSGVFGSGLVTWPSFSLAGSGAFTTRLVTVTVNNPLPAGTTAITNTATVTDDGASGADPTPGNNTTTDVDTITAAPDLTITKTDGVASTTPGSTLVYTLIVTNVGNIGATGVLVTDTIPANTTFVAASNSGVFGSGLVTWPSFSLAGGGAFITRLVTVTVNNPLPAGTTAITNTATVTDNGANGTDPTPGNNTTTDVDTLTATPDLTITKTDGVASTTPGSTLVYTLTVTNVGNIGATGVLVTDTIPANTTFVSASNSGVFGSGLVTWPSFSLAGGGAFITRLVTVTVNNPLPAGTTAITNTATVTDDGANGADPTPANNTDTDVDTVSLGTVSGHLYIDTNGDGNQDVGEPDLANVNVVITDTNGFTQTVATNGTGDWTATVPPGSTTADVDETDPQYPTGYVQTEGTDPTTVTAVAGVNTPTDNDGYFLGGTVSGHLYIDTNGDGNQDVGEPNLANVNVIITDTNGITQTVVTNASGNWTATVPPSSTTADVDETDPQYPTGYTQTEGTDPTTVTAVAGVNTPTDNDGYFLSGTVSGHLYIDTNGDGNQDVGEPNLANVNVIITDTNGITQTVATNASGNWTATVPPGSTTADVDETDPQYPTGYVQTEGTDPTTVTAVAGVNTPTDNDGYFLGGTVSGHLYIDTNSDGNQDVGEPNLANVNVIITDTNGITQTVVTNGAGNWTATVPAGSTTADVDETDPQYPTGYTQTEGTDPTTVTAVAGTNTPTDNDGYYLSGTVSGHLYIDTNGDGNQDVGEPNLANVNVIITDTNGITQTVVTNGTGDWTATVPPGSTTADVDETDPQYPTGYVQTEGTDPTTVTAVAGTNTPTDNDGYFLGGTVSGHLYIDTNGDGNQDVGEPNLANVNVIITDTNGITQTVVTNGAGNWTATVPAGSTTADVDETDPQYPTGYTQTEGTDPTTVTAVAGTNTDAGNDGYYLSGTVSGHLYIDTNGDGNQDVGEPNLANVNVIITDTNGITQTVATNGTGDWTATVPPGSTTADVDETDPQYPTGYIQTEGTDPTTVTAVAGTNTPTDNDGYFLSGTVSGHLYIDTNGDGNQDVGEPDLANVNVIITDTNGITQTVVTNGTGDWTATVPPGSTTADVDETDPQYPTGYTQTEGTDPTTVTAVAGTNTDAGNDGYFLSGTVSGHLYIDTNGNFTQDVGEPDLISVTVIITDVNGTVQTISTDSNGDWTATVPPGSTTADVDETDPQYPTGYVQTEGTDPTTVTAVAGVNTPTDNDGYFLGGTVSGHLYIDTNGDGNQDVGEPNLANVNVIITDTNGITQTVVTNGTGNWTASVPPGSTTADVDETDPQYPTGYTQTEGTDPTTVTAVAGVNTPTDNDGYFLGGTISGHLYIDTNGDGNQDVGEPNLANVNVIITDTNGITQTVVTNGTGDWTASVPPGSTTADVDETDPQYPTGYVQTEGTDPTTVTAVAGVNTPTDNDGYFLGGTISGSVLKDTDNNNTGDTPFAGVTLSLYTDPNGDGDPSDGALVTFDVDPGTVGTQSSVVSAADGSYTLANVPPGSYVVVETQPAGYQTISQSDTTADTPAAPADAATSTDRIPVNLATGETDSGNTFVEEELATIGDFVWKDIDADGIQDGGAETGISGVTVYVDYDGNGARDPGEPFATTNGAGAYSITNINPGTYNVRLENPPTGYTLTTGNNPNNTTLTAGEIDNTFDFGFYTMTLGNQVWNDLDNDGILNGLETGIDGVTVELLDGSGNPIDSNPGLPGMQPTVTTTAGGGFYSFTGLSAGTYIVRLPAINFNPGGVLRGYRSSTGPLPTTPYEPAPDPDANTTDSDDNGTEANGLLGLGGYIQTLPITLTPGGEGSMDAAGATIENRVDFGVNNNPQIELTVTKDDGQSLYRVGSTLTYTIVITNAGPTDATGMTVSDVRPAQITSWMWTCASGTPPGYNCTNDASNPATFTDTLDLPMTQSVTYTVVAQVALAATGTLTNSVTVVPPPGITDITPSDNTDDDVDALALPDLRVTKSDGGVSPMPGGIITYTLNYTNTGTAPATGVVITETVPNNTRYYATASLPTVWSCPNNSAAGTICTTNIPSSVAAGGGSGSVRFGVRVDNPLPGSVNSIINTASIRDDGTNGPDPTPINNVGTVGTIPTAVKLLYFKVNGVSGLKVTLGWATAMEVDHYNFNLYRAPANDFSQATLINSQYGSHPSGATYQYVDTVPNGGQWWYWLKDVDTHGRETFDASTNVKVGVGPGINLYYIYLPFVINGDE